MPFKASIEVAAALIFDSDRLLIAQRPPGVHLEGLWEFPGGKREPGETYEACLLREIREELGCEVLVVPCCTRRSMPTLKNACGFAFFNANWSAGSLNRSNVLLYVGFPLVHWGNFSFQRQIKL